MADIEEEPFVRCPTWHHLFRKLLHSAGLSGLYTFFDVWLWYIESFRFDYLYYFSCYFIILVFKILTFFNNIKRSILRFCLIYDRSHIGPRSYYNWNTLFNNSSFIWGDLLSSIAEQFLMIQTDCSDCWHFWSDDVCGIVSSSQSDFDWGKIALLIFEVEEPWSS